MTNLDSWLRSIICLSYEINQLVYGNNLLTDSATARHEFFFADLGVPVPRPCTAFAWASLCSFGPSYGVIHDAEASSGRSHRTDPRRSRFLVPFLPKIRHGEDTTQSLLRTSKAHARDSAGNIRWGSVFVGESDSGEIIEQLQHGAIDSKLWMLRDSLAPLRNEDVGRDKIPPLYSYVGEGWEFGIIQSIHSLQLTLRDPMIELARSGIPMLARIPSVPPVRKLLIRFLDVNSVRKWGSEYSRALHAAWDSDLVLADALSLAGEIREAEARRFKDQKKDFEGKKAKSTARIDLASLGDLLKGGI